MKRPSLALIGLVVLAGCTVGPEYRPPVEATDELYHHGASEMYTGTSPTGEFWRVFSDPILDGLVKDSTTSNYDMQIALANLMSARAAYRVASLDLLPTVTLDGGYQKQRLSTVESLGFDRNQSFFDIGFDAIWELDFFGRIRRQTQAARASFEAREATFDDVRLSVIAELVRTYLELRGQQLQLSVLRRNIDNQTESLRLTKERADVGRDSGLDEFRARAQLSSTTALVAPLEAAIARSIHRISVLTGRKPDALHELLAVQQELPPLPSSISIDNPSNLLRRRSDVRIAERQLAAATARIGVATADLFPRITFIGEVGFAAEGGEELGNSASRRYLVAPRITWAAFDLGRVRSKIQSARADSDAALARFHSTVLRALEDTENALAEHAAARSQLEQTTDAVDASRKAADLSRLRYLNGREDFLQYLDAERTLLAAEDRYAKNRTEAAVSLIVVYKALAGDLHANVPR